MRDKLRIEGEVVSVAVLLGPDGKAEVTLDGERYEVDGFTREDGLISFHLNGAKHRFSVLNRPDAVVVSTGRAYHTFARVNESVEALEEESASELTSQMPGTVLKHLVEPGTGVEKGTPLMILEAMKMEHEICAPSDGEVVGYPKGEGERVMPGDLLVEFTDRPPG